MKYFGTDGIRGIPNEKLTIDLVTKLGMALASLNSKEVVIATDTRVSKDMLAYAIASGCMSRGMNVIFAGVMPTPTLIYYSYTKKITGVMITASHNPYVDNGIKILNNGFKLSEDEELMVEALIDNPKDYDGEIGKFIIDNNAKDDYIRFILSNITKTNIKVCIDCAHGATYQTAPLVFGEITNNLVVIANKPDGYNINNGVGSTHLELLRKTVILNKCDIGFAFDGDGDRVLCVDKFGNTIDGDMLIYILARYLKKHNKLNENKVVLTIMSNLGLIDDLKKNGIDVIETKVGDKYVVQDLFKNHLSLGGENSGHIIMPDIFYSGDGVLVASIIVKILVEEKCSIHDLLSDVYMYSNKIVNIKVNNKENVLNSNLLLNRIEEIRRKLDYDCKIIVRASGTEDLIRVSVMAKNAELVELYSNELINIINCLNLTNN